MGVSDASSKLCLLLYVIGTLTSTSIHDGNIAGTRFSEQFYLYGYCNNALVSQHVSHAYFFIIIAKIPPISRYEVKWE
jgi:hypothetical protein